MRGNTWTPEQWEEARALFAGGKTRGEIALLVGRPITQVSQKIHWEGLSPERREAVRRRTNERRQRIAGTKPRQPRKPYTPAANVVTFEKAPMELFAERAIRQKLEHRDLTGAFFGDPLPGYSALDQREQRT